ncbi:NAD(P)-binding protein [Glonium stellatum]|uniref:NAD(P)-binding protein n=1 Tax=Glonium stellatum TaxID=574774 RepID=A0A8E2JQ15_9PEZI|nr:NAD(P)-binding protein [Glonium stellatum]
MRAAALNARDMMVIAHDPIYPGDHIEDLVPCADGAGEVEEVGEGSKWKVGDRVLVHVNSWIEDTEEMLTVPEVQAKGSDKYHGTLRQYAVWDDEHLIMAPFHLTFEEIATMPACSATAVNAPPPGPMSFRPGMTILAQGTGGVSCFVIQLASAVGAKVIATSSSDDKLALAKSIGATHTINYISNPNWAVEALRLTNGKGVDHVVDVAGAETVEQSLQATKQGGLISLVGFLTESKKSDLVPSLIFGGKTARGVFNFTKSMTEEAVKIFEQHKLHPVVAKVFEWKDAKEAFKMLSQQSAVGKIVIKI